MNHDTCVERFLKRVETEGNKPAYHVKKEGVYTAYTWAQVGQKVESFAKGLISMGFREGDALAILSYNRPEWLWAAMAAQASHGSCAGIYSSCSPEEVAYVLGHCEAPFVVVENGKRYREQIKPILSKLPNLKKVILMDPDDIVGSEQVMTFDEVLSKGSTMNSKVFSDRVSRIKPEGVAS
ncbi:MAG: AMP-binding protein, partial [Deltaproteobacteria bacterium]|nr:AMP-binding protein [Deltaproteobacteria bacterium]